MSSTFYHASVFDQDLSQWNVDNVTSHDDFSTGSALTEDKLPDFPPEP